MWTCGMNVSPGYLKFFLAPVIRYSYVDIGMYRYTYTHCTCFIRLLLARTYANMCGYPKFRPNRQIGREIILKNSKKLHTVLSHQELQINIVSFLNVYILDVLIFADNRFFYSNCNVFKREISKLVLLKIEYITLISLKNIVTFFKY